MSAKPFTLVTALILFLSTFFVTTGSAALNPLGQASTAGFYVGSVAGQTARGWDFMVNAPNLVVTELGVSAGYSMPITLSLWDTSAQLLLAQTEITAENDRIWTFGALGLPVTLTQGRVYSVIGWAAPTEIPWYLFDNSPPAVFSPVGDIEYLRSRVENGIGANVLPTDTYGGQYGVADIGYIVQNTVPEPSAFLLLGAGFGGLAILRRRR